MRFHEKILALCTSRRWDRYDLLPIVGDVSKSTIDNWFRGKTVPGLVAALKIAREFDVPLEYLADDEIEGAPEKGELPEDERIALRLYRSLRRQGMSLEEFEDRLLAPVPMVARDGSPASSTGHSIDPKTGVPLDPGSDRHRGAAG